MRKVILHYHLFKNAGTSLDAAFKENFSEEKGEWVTKEFPNQPAANREQVRQWILDNPQAKCFSSHTSLFPVPEFEDIEVFPVVFVRHPIDRIASAYSFEKRQGDKNFGSTLARNTDLKGYIETRLSLTQDRQCRNFHEQRLATTAGKILEADAHRALAALKRLQHYDLSIKTLQAKLKDFGFEDIELKSIEKNKSSRVSSDLNEKLDEIKVRLGEKLYNELLRINDSDIRIWNAEKDKYESEINK